MLLLIEVLPEASPNKTLGLSPLTQNRNRDRHSNYYPILNSKYNIQLLYLIFRRYISGTILKKWKEVTAAEIVS